MAANKGIFDVDKFWERVKFLASEKEITMDELSIGIGVNVKSISNSIGHHAFPRVEVTTLIAMYFEVSVEYLMTGKDAQTNGIYWKLKYNELETKYIELEEKIEKIKKSLALLH